MVNDLLKFIKVGDTVLLKTEEELWETYPKYNMPCGFVRYSEMEHMLGTYQKVHDIFPVNADRYTYCITINGWMWPEGAFNFKTKKGNSLL